MLWDGVLMITREFNEYKDYCHSVADLLSERAHVTAQARWYEKHQHDGLWFEVKPCGKWCGDYGRVSVSSVYIEAKYCAQFNAIYIDTLNHFDNVTLYSTLGKCNSCSRYTAIHVDFDREPVLRFYTCRRCKEKYSDTKRQQLVLLKKRLSRKKKEQKQLYIKPQNQGYIYFYMRDNILKAGYTSNHPETRRSYAESIIGSESVLLGYINGTRQDEMVIHKKLQEITDIFDRREFYIANNDALSYVYELITERTNE